MKTPKGFYQPYHDAEPKEERPMNEEDKSKYHSFVGMSYTTELGRQMPFGAIINSKGVITRVMTEKDYPEL